MRWEFTDAIEVLISLQSTIQCAHPTTYIMPDYFSHISPLIHYFTPYCISNTLGIHLLASIQMERKKYISLCQIIYKKKTPHYYCYSASPNGWQTSSPDKRLLLTERHTIKGKRAAERSHSADGSTTVRVHKVNHHSQYGVCPVPGIGWIAVTDRGTEWVTYVYTVYQTLYRIAQPHNYSFH